MGKRGQGEGTIRKRADGRWEAMITIPQDDGSTKRHSIYGKSQAEVRRKLTEARRTLDQGDTLITDRQTVADFLERWLRDVVEPDRAPATYRAYAGVVRLHLIPALGKHQLAKLTPQHVQAMIRAKSAGELAGNPCTVQRLREVLRNALNQALRWGLVTKNAAALVAQPRYQRPEVAPFSPEEARAFLAAAAGDRLEAVYTVALALGLRQGEALGLRWDDVDFAVGTLRVQRQLQRVKGALTLRELKTAKSRRTLPLPGTLATALKAHRTRQLEERLLLGEKWQGDGSLIFTTTIGTPLDPSNVLRRFQGIVKDAGLPHQRFHDLRHACASLLLAQGVPPRVVMETLGHSQISLTMNTYAHVMPIMQRDAADLMDAFLAGG